MAGSPQSEGRLSEVKFLTVAEVATLMRVSKMTVYRLVHSGELTAVRVGRSFRVPEHAVHEYLRGRSKSRRSRGYPGVRCLALVMGRLTYGLGCQEAPQAHG
ncbi:hypothetical protein Prum_047250 [Phytohabitans rumicis]|uniref:Helix-turn-helix domain-containing protein n=1 Tax=Phytohabitans rumicis TaxID=1076125 RepID=A0A6V8L1D2_9ACTN|nr:hypothetical protein Prum_047250 [Phytohabitans rumicis]